MLVARYRDQQPSIFISAPGEAKLRDLAALGIHQTLSLPEHRGQAVIRLIDGMRRWSKAKPVGHLALVRRDTTVKRMRDLLCGLCCGADFNAILTSPRATRFDEAQRKVGGSQGFGSRMRRSTWPLGFDQAVGEFVRYADHYEIESDEGIARIALTLAFNPLQLKLPGIEDKKAFFAELLGRRHLLRGAFLAYAVAKEPDVALKESA